mmetsp:Transcript_38952/g.74598  ORF Transcript_38952/g.74598 Transcript_38952/m.74598 type:complete len:345 (+) Transcript_38952:169-1203(+)
MALSQVICARATGARTTIRPHIFIPPQKPQNLGNQTSPAYRRTWSLSVQRTCASRGPVLGMRAHSKNEILLEDDAEEEHVMYDAWGDDVDVVVEVSHDEAEVASVLCDTVADKAEKSIAKHGAFTLAIPGGSVAKALGGLVDKDIDWSKVHVFFVNERCPDQKNYKLARSVFADAVGLPLEQLYTIEAADKSPSEEAARYEAMLVGLPETVMLRNGSGLPRFDMVLLGMGADGHVGSIYPDSPEMEAEEGLILGVEKPDKLSISFSLKLINSADTVVIAATGTKKAATVSAAWDMPLEESERQQMKMLPVMMVDPVDGLVVWLLDLDAASELDVDDEDQDPDVP